MTRARASALVLVNWKGVFYERYELDRRVTALEGANGAGKTTVMIAAYIVLLPDMSRLRFTNLGETAATGGDRGIWGRLGEPQRPSYAALEVELGGGARVVLGVLLTRKAEPTVELTPFLISELPPGVRMQDLLLVLSDAEEAVPELAELRESVTKHGAKLSVFSSAKDYFAALFELGIGALRLSSEEDRGRLADMLRTSMTGGISRAITADLRSFLLREQGSLGDTLGRMRENLQACRRTRLEVSEAQLLEQEISGVYDAGQSMFAAALQTTRESARELREAAKRLEQQAARARQAVLDGARATEALAEREAQAAKRLGEERAALDAFRDRARQDSSLLALRERQRAGEAEHAPLLERALETRAAHAQAAAEREAKKQRRQSAQRDQERAALGLADLQAGLDELHRRSSAHRHAERLLAAVTALLPEASRPQGGSAPVASELSAELSQTTTRLSELDRERLSAERTLTLAAERQGEWQRALLLLKELGHDGDEGAALERARTALRELDTLARDVTEKPALLAQLGEERRLAQRQQAAQTAAAALGLALEGGSSLERIEARLAAADAVLLQQETRKQTLEAELRAASAERGLVGQQLARCQQSLGKHRRLLQRVERITAVAGPFAPTREAAQRLRDSLSAERQELTAQLEQQTATRELLLQSANELEASGGQFPAELLRLRDELDGELLGNRFEELDLGEAARLEALLGPLTQAIVVDDVDEARRRLEGKPRELAELRLIAAGTELGFDARGVAGPAGGQDPADAHSDAYVMEGPALRVTRRPERPSLGRRAREARTEELRRQAAELVGSLERAQARLRALATALTELDQLLPEAELLEGGDPAALQATLHARDQELSAAEQTLEAALGELATSTNTARAEATRFRALLAEAFLLDAPSHAELAARLSGRLQALEGAEARLTRSSAARRELEPLLEALRAPPTPPAELERLQNERERLGAERDRLFALQRALEQLCSELPALGWADAEQALLSSEQVAPALQEQHQLARAAFEAAEEDVAGAEAAWELATSELMQAEGALAASAAHAARLAEELSSLGDNVAFSPEEAAARLAELSSAAERLALEERDLVAQRGAQAERVRQLGLELGALERQQQDALKRAEPAAARWQALRERASAAQLLQAGEASDHDQLPSALALAAEARSRAELLCDRLSTARGGESLARELGELSFDDQSDGAFLEAWLRVREWLARRVPAQVAQVDDPLLALERLRGHLSLLERRLLHQEGDLRGASEDVARGIEVQLRRAKAQVRRLNQNLDGVSFGSIAGIRVELRRAQQMEPVLRALSEGSAQELLFQSNLPMEDALGEILKRYGGGRSGAARVLDYREYLELLVEVQRKADGSWEQVSPTRLSTGEAIGVGAALMMVVLAEWERDANLLRARRGPGSLRLLFLDEANRLSQDNLGSLFDLCENLDLQLLIAAPEVARSEGNTTYRLVRKVTEDGREEVIVSGRRALTADPTSAALPAAATQGSLFEN